MSRLQPASSNREHTDYPSTYWHAHYRETSTASFLQECLTGVSWTLLIFFKLGVKNEAGIVEGIGRGFMHHSTVLQTCLSRRCWIPGRCLEDMNWVWSDWRFDGVSWVEGASLVSQGKTLHQTHTHGGYIYQHRSSAKCRGGSSCNCRTHVSKQHEMEREEIKALVRTMCFYWNCVGLTVCMWEEFWGSACNSLIISLLLFL